MTMPCARQMPVTISAIRIEGPSRSLVEFEVVGVARGKKMRKRRRLSDRSANAQQYRTRLPNMTVKQDHCTPTWAMPSSPAKQANPLISLQQAMSSRLRGSTNILANWHVPDVVPKRTKYGERPKEERRLMIRWC